MATELKPAIDRDESFFRIGKWIMAGIVLSFFGGIALFATIGMERIGDPIPMDAAPNYFMADAGDAE